MDDIIEFKEHKLRLQFESPMLDSRLVTIIYALAGYSCYKYHKSLMITELIRTQEEQDAIYGNNPAYQQQKWQSVHQYGRGVDLRIFYFKDDELADMLKWLSNTFTYATPNKFTALLHDVGQGKHLHVQVAPGNETVIKKQE